MSGYDEQAWCECGHEMELVRPGKHQKVGCCERIAELEERQAETEAWLNAAAFAPFETFDEVRQHCQSYFKDHPPKTCEHEYYAYDDYKRCIKCNAKNQK